MRIGCLFVVYVKSNSRVASYEIMRHAQGPAHARIEADDDDCLPVNVI